MQHGRHASITVFADFIKVITLSGTGLTYADPEAEYIELSIDVSDEGLGQALIKAFERSRQGSTEELMRLVNEKLVSKRLDNWQALKIKALGYKNKSELWRNAKGVGAFEADGTINLTPMVHERLDSFYATKDIEKVKVSGNSTPSEVGAAIRRAISLCK